MPINSPSYEIAIQLVAPGSEVEYLCVSEGALSEFLSDPDSFAAKYFGLSLDQYIEWIDVNGCALCGCKTKKGKPCRGVVVGRPMRASEWKATHREMACFVHGGDT